ncbi:MAG: YSC84-related protein, partial [Verrucomicrobia bacterium]|nr:YSC84-related protein [Verrucomicrobiota bacterium]
DFGGADNDYVILLMTDAAIGKWANKEDFGSSSASAVCGPKGGAAVDATMKDKEFYVYIWNKGAKLGANFGGFSVDIPAGPNADFYEKPMVSAKDIVNNDVKVPDSKKDMLTRLYGLLK